MQPPEGFQVTDASGQASSSWGVPANGTRAVQVTFTPRKEGRVRAVLVFRFADGSEAGRLALSAAVVAAVGTGPGLAGAAALVRPVPRPAMPQPRALRPGGPPAIQPAQQPGEKRARAAAGLATPRDAPAAAAAAADASTPSLQRVKKAREINRMGLVGPAAAAAVPGARRAPDPATPTHAVMRHSSDKPPGSVEEATPGAGPLVPRLQLGKVQASPAAGAALGSSRFVQELATAGRDCRPASARQAGSPALVSARTGIATAKTFTHFHTRCAFSPGEG